MVKSRTGKEGSSQKPSDNHGGCGDPMWILVILRPCLLGSERTTITRLFICVGGEGGANGQPEMADKLDRKGRLTNELD
jgi:hypothetical protein